MFNEAGKRIYFYAINAVRNAEAISALSSQSEVPLLRIVSNSSSHMTLLLTHYYLQQKVCYGIFRVVWCRILLLFFWDIRVIYFSYDVSWVIMIALLISQYRKVFRSIRSNPILCL